MPAEPQYPGAPRSGAANAEIVRISATTSYRAGWRRLSFGAVALTVVAAGVLAGCGELKPVEFTRKPTTTVEPPELPDDQLGSTTLPNLRPARYEVQPGDTIGSIATKFGLTIDSLLVANDLTDPNQLEAGTILRIPGPNTTTPPPWLQREERRN